MLVQGSGFVVMWAVLNPNNHIKKVTPTCDILLQLMLRGRISLKLRLNLEHEAGACARACACV